MGSVYSMSAVVKNNYLPLHEFQYMIRGYFPPDLVTYSTEIYTGQMIYSHFDTISGIAPRNDKAFQDSIGILENINIFWVVNKSLGPGLEDYDVMNSSGPHKIFLTYDTPLLDTVNTLALGKICKYAEGLDSIPLIAQAGVNGVYGEGWNYSTDHPTFADPLNVIRQHVGMCTDYANLLTYLYRAVGIESNSTVIINGIMTSPDTVALLLWRFSEMPGVPYIPLLTRTLRACDGDTRQWIFQYHAVTRCFGYFCDASLSIFVPQANYAPWWRYYLHPRSFTGPYLHNEPPMQAPVYYDWNYYIPGAPNSFIPWHRIFYESGWIHPAP
jgi:hypothetical protein